MPLTVVTITGADDGVEPQKLTELTKKYPFVEWGILRSTKREGEARYPSQQWLNDLAFAFRLMRRGHLSAHLCGTMSRRVLAGDLSLLASDDVGPNQRETYARYQLNGAFSYRLPLLLCAERYPRQEFILQVQSSLQFHDGGVLEVRERNVAFLFDPSGGTGKSPECAWPLSPVSVHVGYAGGLSASNLEREVGTLCDMVDQAFWVDMESGVRTENRFDLQKVEQALEICKPYVAGLKVC